MIGLSEARRRARTRVDRDVREWAANGGADAEFAVTLKPPTEREAMADLGAAIAWAREWNGIAGVEWAVRRWPSAGAQQIPQRLMLSGADAIAAFAGAPSLRAWRCAQHRADRLRSALVPAEPASVGGAQSTPADSPAAQAGTPGAVDAAIRSHTRAILDLDEPDFERLLHVVAWLSAHPASGWRIRQLPIRGVDTKWVGRHRGLVEAFHSAASGHDELGLIGAPTLVRMRILDPSLRPGGLADVTAPVKELAALALRPERVFVLENLESVLAMPEMPGAVVLHGAGFGAGDRLGRIPWLTQSPVDYWGDLDSNGFAILNQLRATLPQASSVLMDTGTLYRYRDLWVPEPKPAAGVLTHLTAGEQAALNALRAEGNVRLEQERIEWAYALRALGCPE